MGSRKTACTAYAATLHFSGGQIGVTLANIICKIFPLLKPFDFDLFQAMHFK